MLDLEAHLHGLLLGTAVGDTLGLPAEGLTRAQIQRRFRGPWRHRFLLRRGMLSDDTEHTLFVAQALLAHPDDPAAFQRALAWKLRWWFLGLPAGMGLATLRSILKLWSGFPARRGGVFSAGNGPAMRSALLGAWFAADGAQLRAFVAASTTLTHTDPRAQTGAMAVAMAAAEAVRGEPVDPGALLARLAPLAGPADHEWLALLQQIGDQLAVGMPVGDFAERLGLGRGISGYVYHTVPMAIYAWLRHPRDFAAALTSVLDCGGDTDTVGAIVGALAGAAVGPAGIPAAWLSGIVDWPRSLRLLRRVGTRLTAQRRTGQRLGQVSYPWLLVAPRNALFLAVVLGHGLRRLLPPYRPRDNPLGGAHP